MAERETGSGLQRRLAFVAVDSTTGAVMGRPQNPTTPIAPASLTKLMTTYELFAALKEGRASWDDRIPVTQHSMQQTGRHGGRLIYGNRDDTISMQEALGGMLVRSANDAAIAVGKYIARTENPTLDDAAADRAFVERMNTRAAALGMHQTRFVDASGLPRGEGRERRDTVSTACDMATLGLALKHHFPETVFQSALSTERFNFRNFWEREKGSNLQGASVPGATVDVKKTGYVETGGYSVVASAARQNQEVLAVQIGGTTAEMRDNAWSTNVRDALSATRTVAWSRVCGPTGGVPTQGAPVAAAPRYPVVDVPETQLANSPVAPAPTPATQTDSSNTRDSAER